jgi:hypothetical protein
MGSMPGSVKSKIIKWVFVVSPLSTHQDQGRIPPPSAIEKNMIFWRKIMIFHTKYPKNIRASLSPAQFF